MRWGYFLRGRIRGYFINVRKKTHTHGTWNIVNSEKYKTTVDSFHNSSSGLLYAAIEARAILRLGRASTKFMGEKSIPKSKVFSRSPKLSTHLGGCDFLASYSTTCREERVGPENDLAFVVVSCASITKVELFQESTFRSENTLPKPDFRLGLTSLNPGQWTPLPINITVVSFSPMMLSALARKAKYRYYWKFVPARANRKRARENRGIGISQ